MTVGIVIVNHVPCDASTGAPLTEMELSRRTELLRGWLRSERAAYVALGYDDQAARSALGEWLDLLIALDRTAGMLGDPLFDTDESDWT